MCVEKWHTQDDPSQVRPNLIPPGEFSVEVQQAWVKPGRVDPFHLGCLLKDLVTNRVRMLYLSSIVIVKNYWKPYYKRFHSIH
jgi:hypothetical protein